MGNASMHAIISRDDFFAILIRWYLIVFAIDMRNFFEQFMSNYECNFHSLILLSITGGKIVVWRIHNDFCCCYWQHLMICCRINNHWWVWTCCFMFNIWCLMHIYGRLLNHNSHCVINSGCLNNNCYWLLIDCAGFVKNCWCFSIYCCC